MANVSVSSISTSNGNTTLTGTCVSGATVQILNGTTVLGTVTAAAGVTTWTISFPSANNSSVEVKSEGKTENIIVNVTTGVVTYPAYEVVLVVN